MGATLSPWLSQGLPSYSVAVDAAGDVYVADLNDYKVLKESPSSSGYTQSVVSTGVPDPLALAVDAAGDVYVGDVNQILLESVTAAPALVFPATPVATFFAALSFALSNIGNQPLTILNSGPSANAVFQNTTAPTPACPYIGSVPAGSTCNFAFNFYPGTVGPSSYVSTLEDNSLNLSPAAQTIALSGTATQGLQFITFFQPPAPLVYVSGESLTVSATASSGLPVSFTVSGAGTNYTTPLSSPATIRLGGTGTLTITAMQPGNASYAAASTVTRTVQIVAPPPTSYTATTTPVGSSSTLTATLTFLRGHNAQQQRHDSHPGAHPGRAQPRLHARSRRHLRRGHRLRAVPDLHRQRHLHPNRKRLAVRRGCVGRWLRRPCRHGIPGRLRQRAPNHLRAGRAEHHRDLRGSIRGCRRRRKRQRLYRRSDRRPGAQADQRERRLYADGPRLRPELPGWSCGRRRRQRVHPGSASARRGPNRKRHQGDPDCRRLRRNDNRQRTELPRWHRGGCNGQRLYRFRVWRADTSSRAEERNLQQPDRPAGRGQKSIRGRGGPGWERLCLRCRFHHRPQGNPGQWHLHAKHNRQRTGMSKWRRGRWQWQRVPLGRLH